MFYTNKSIVIDKIINQVWFRKNKLWRFCNPTKIALLCLGKEKCNVLQLKEVLTQSLGNLGELNLYNITEEEKRKIIYYANQSLVNKFNYLGSGWIEIKPFSWLTDFKNSYKWEVGKFYQDYVKKPTNKEFDIKIVREYNRFHHLLWLAEAYLITKNKIYSNKIIEHIKSWIEENPFMYSINWECSMDVGIRAINWLYAITMIIDSGDIDNDFANNFYQSIFLHGFFIINNLEKNIPLSGNHYLSNLAGLIFIYSIFPKNRFGKFCFKFAKKEFFNETQTQISPDGTNYEHSISYHRLVTEIFLSTYALLLRKDIKIPNKLINRLIGAVSYVYNYTKNNGLSPLIGDNDDGRLLPFIPRDFREHSYLLSVGEKILGIKFQPNLNINCESIFLGEGLTNEQSNNEIKKNDYILYPDNGLAIVRNQNLELFVTNSNFSFNKNKLGKGSGTHTHSDALSFELCIGGEDFIVDPGTYTYTFDPFERNNFRKTSNHNTLFLSNKNQTDFHELHLFHQTDFLKNRELRIIKEKIIKILGSYQYLKEDVLFNHERTFEIFDNKLRIVDKINSNKEDVLNLNLILSPQINPIIKNEKIKLKGKNTYIDLTISTKDGNLPISIKEIKTSPSYGVILESHKLESEIVIPINTTMIIFTEFIWEPK